MRFCLAYPNYPTENQGAGVGTYARILAQQLIDHGHEVTIVTLANTPETHPIDEGGIRIVRCTHGNIHWYLSKIPIIKRTASAIRELEYSYALWRAASRLHRETPFDIVQGTETGGVLLALFAPRSAMRFVLRLHGEKYTIYQFRPDREITIDLKLNRLIQRIALRNTKYLMAATAIHASNIAQEIKRPVSEIAIIPNMIDYEELEELTSQPLESQRDATPGPVVLFAGRLERGKGLWPLLEAAPAVISAIPDVKFLFAGSPHPTLSATELDDMVMQNQLSENVEFLGHVRWQDLIGLYRQCRVFAMPSYYETFGNTFVEAMLMGKPVVGFSGSSLEEIVEHGVSGFIVDRDNISQLSETLIRLLSDQHLCERVGKAAFRRARDSFSATAVMPTLLGYYEEIYSDTKGSLYRDIESKNGIAKVTRRRF